MSPILPVLIHLSFVISLHPFSDGIGLYDPYIPLNEVGEASASDPGQYDTDFQDTSDWMPGMEQHHGVTEAPPMEQHHVVTEPPSFNVLEYVQQMNILPKILTDSDQDIWFRNFHHTRTTQKKQPLKGEPALASYALSKFWDIYQSEGYKINLAAENIPKTRFIRSIAKDKTLYRLPNAEIPIYFVFGASSTTPRPSNSFPLYIYFWMFEDAPQNYIKKHFLGVAYIPLGQIQDDIMSRLPEETFKVPNSKKDS